MPYEEHIAEYKRARKLGKFRKTFYRKGRRFVRFLALKFGLHIETIEGRKKYLAQLLMDRFDRTVGYGLLQGYILPSNASWAPLDTPSKLLGLYEAEVLTKLKEFSRNHTHLIDLGAADGFYGVGTVACGIFQDSICFEASEISRAVLAESAEENGVSGKISINGLAQANFYDDLREDFRRDSVLLIDIEGGEFSIMGAKVFSAFSKSPIIIEAHPWMVEDGEINFLKLIKLSKNTHRFSTLTTGARDPSACEEVKLMNDDDRWLVCSEGRPRLMEWLVFVPIA